MLVHRIHQRSTDASSLLQRLNRDDFDPVGTVEIGEQTNTQIAIDGDVARKLSGVDELGESGDGRTPATLKSRQLPPLIFVVE